MRCIWCGKKGDPLEAHEYAVKDALGLRYKRITLHVHPAHRPPLENYLRRYNRYARCYLASLAVLTTALVVTLLTGAFTEHDMRLYNGLIVTAMGACIFIFPFATPATNAVLGLKASSRLVRLLGGGIAVGAFLTLVVDALP